MNGRALAVGATIMALLVVMAQPASAAHVAVYDFHTTDTEFNNAQELTDVTVVGSGASAYVNLSAQEPTIDSFEDGDISEYTGETANFSVVSTGSVKDGTFKLKADSADAGYIASTSGLPRYYGVDDGNYTVYVRLGDPNRTARVGIAANGTGFFQGVELQGDLVQLGPREETTVCADMCSGDAAFVDVPANEYVEVVIRQTDQVSGQDIDVWVFNASGGRIAKLSDNIGDDADFGDGIAFYSNASGVDFDHAHIPDLDAKHATGTYLSANYTVENVNDGWTNLTLDNASATVTWQGTNGATWNDVASQTYSTDGNRTIDLSGTSYDTWRVNVTYTRQSGATTARLHDEGIRYQSRTPNVNDSSASPTGFVTTASTTLEIDASDGDFPLAHGDSVDVEFFLKGPGDSSFQSEGTDTLTSNGTASTSVSSLAGEYEWYAVATDSEGNTIQSQTFSFGTPGTLHIYNETAPDNLINDREITVTFHIDNGSDALIRRTTTNGTVPFNGNLVTDAPITAVINTTGYYNTTFRYKNTLSNRTAFLLNSTEATYDVRFTLTDRTNNFPDENTTVLVQKPINQSGNLQYRTVWSDVFGAGGTVKTKLKQEERYRIIIRNRKGQTRTLGPYVADRDELVSLEVGVLTFSQGDADTYLIGTHYKPEPNGPDVIFNFSDPTNQTSQLRVIITNRSSDTVIFNQSFSNLGDLQVLEDRGVNDTASYTIEWRGVRDGRAFNGTRIVGPTRSPGLPLDSIWKETFAVVLIVVVGGGLTGLDPTIASVGAALTGGLMWFIGWLPNVVGAGVIAFAILIAAASYAQRGGV